VEVDLGAEKLLAAEKGNEKIAIESRASSALPLLMILGMPTVSLCFTAVFSATTSPKESFIWQCLSSFTILFFNAR
jgi:hypothetical protein